MKVNFKRKARKLGLFPVMNISFKEITQGKAIALCNALVQHAQTSIVTADLVEALRNQVQQNSQGGDDDQALIQILSGKMVNQNQVADV